MRVLALADRPFHADVAKLAANYDVDAILTLGDLQPSWLETLAKPLREGNVALESLFRAFLTAREVRLTPATLPLWEHAARLRALGLRTPDALHAATGLSAGVALFLTNDPVFRRVPLLPLQILSEAVSP